MNLYLCLWPIYPIVVVSRRSRQIKNDDGREKLILPTILRDGSRATRDLVANNLKGSGDYGVFAFGVYNGQGANRVELNNDMHMVARDTYPYQFANGQIFEAGVEALHGLRYIERRCKRNYSGHGRARARICR